MDEATRAELAELRRRAYGPQPDILGDAVAMSRLTELESLAHGDHTPPPLDEGVLWVDRRGSETVDPAQAHDAGREGERDAAPVAVATIETPSAVVDDDEPAPKARRRRRGAGIAFAAALVAVLVGAATAVTPSTLSSDRVAVETTRSAYTLARDEDAVVLIQVPLHNVLGTEGQLPLPSDTPPFPTSGKTLWAEHLGSYYGWQLWIGAAKGMLQEEQCILVARAGVGKGRCVVAPLRSQSALAVTLPYISVPVEDRPAALAPGMRLGFWWFHDSAVTVVLAAAPEDR
ncbi:hypothetical protein ACH3VR_13165 [Microbacterium sp. B2969]|uniref:Uncharacterized protein n=1 Tax=Microbacterium alkaliflavum TaxID=3248839 RepID=A0ABW7Q8W0_9MICO